jgi:hypothetical protein
MLRGAREEDAKLQQRRRSSSLADSGGGATSEEDEPEGRAGGLSRSLEVSACAAAATASALGCAA